MGCVLASSKKAVDPAQLSEVNVSASNTASKMNGNDLSTHSKPTVTSPAKSMINEWDRKATGGENTTYRRLPRGGIIVNTILGGVQFGIPPETIKDSMKLGIPVPNYFVVPNDMFDKSSGRSMAEFEFPAYFNFFIKKKRVTLVCSKSLESRINEVFQETLLGPIPQHLMLREDFASNLDSSYYPNFQKEGFTLDANREHLQTSTLVDIITYDENNKEIVLHGAEPGQGEVVIKANVVRKEFTVYDVPPSTRNREKLVTLVEGQDYEVVQAGGHSMAPAKRPMNAMTLGMPMNFDGESINIPKFGVTFLGTSHGFDAQGINTGFVIWINRRGIMVDPPVGSNYILSQMCIPAKIIDGVILTHCHADHDAGTFQKILFEQKVRLYTTQTIFDSFMRKYKSISGYPIAFLETLMLFNAVRIGEPVTINDARFQFFYSLHTIPCMGFRVFYQGYSMVYSADTNSTPNLPDILFDAGHIGAGRRDLLKDGPLNPSHHPNLVLHEAGVPPIHTPMKVLEEAPQEIKDVMFIVHAAAAQIPPDSNLRTAKMHDTLYIDKTDDASAQEHIPILSSVPLLSVLFELCDDRGPKIVNRLNCTRERFTAGSIIFEANAPIHKWYVIESGQALEYNSSGKTVRRCVVGDSLGDSVLVGKMKDYQHPIFTQLISPLRQRMSASESVIETLFQLLISDVMSSPTTSPLHLDRTSMVAASTEVAASSGDVSLPEGLESIFSGRASHQAKAQSDVSVLVIDVEQLYQSLQDTPVMFKVLKNSVMQQSVVFNALNRNILFKRASFDIKQEFLSLLGQPYSQPVGVVDYMDFYSVFIVSGKCKIMSDYERAQPSQSYVTGGLAFSGATLRGGNARPDVDVDVSTGVLVVDINSLITKSERVNVVMEVVDNEPAFLCRVDHERIRLFLLRYPGMMFQLLDSLYADVEEDDNEFA